MFSRRHQRSEGERGRGKATAGSNVLVGSFWAETADQHNHGHRLIYIFLLLPLYRSLVSKEFRKIYSCFWTSCQDLQQKGGGELRQWTSPSWLNSLCWILRSGVPVLPDARSCMATAGRRFSDKQICFFLKCMHCQAVGIILSRILSTVAQ